MHICKKIFFLLAFSGFTVLEAAAQNPAISDEEALKQGRWLEKAAADRNQAALNHFFDIDSLLYNIKTKSASLQDPAFLDGFRESFTKSMESFGSRLAMPSKGGSYHLLREYDRKGKKHLLFRSFGTNGLNYHDYTLIKVKDSIKTSDVYMYTSDEEMSSTMAQLVEIMAASQDISKITEDVRGLVQITQYRNQKNYTAARETYEKLDSHYQQIKSIQIIYIDVCHHLNDTLYQNALERFNQAFPEATNGYLMMIDLYFLEKNYAKGLIAIDKLDELIGKDPFLDFYRGQFTRLSGGKEEGLAYYEKVYQYDPTIAANTRQLITAYAVAGKWDKAKSVISQYKTTADFNQTELDNLYSKYPDLK